MRTRNLTIALTLLLTLLLSALSAAAEVEAAVTNNPDTGEVTVTCRGLYPGNDYALAILRGSKTAWTEDSLLFLNRFTADGNGELTVAFIHMGLPDGTVMLGGYTGTGVSPIKLGNTFGDAGGGSAFLPAAMTVISEEAFMGSTFSHVFMGDQVTDIGARAFKNCSKLREVHIPDSVTSIGADAFAGCPNVVIVCGTEGAALSYAQDNGLAYRIE